MTVYALTFTDTELSYDGHSEDFGIGIFSTREKAAETAREYLKHVPGFCEYPCTYRIEEKKVVEAKRMPGHVWIVYGWNTNDNYDEIEIVESECYLIEPEAALAMRRMQERYHRTEWCLNCFEIDKWEWQNGYCRV